MMTISKVAEAAGMSVKTVRYYGDIELVAAPQRSPSGYRLYDARSLRKLIFVRRARSFGFSIEECRELLNPTSKSAVNSNRNDPTSHPNVLQYIWFVTEQISFPRGPRSDPPIGPISPNR